MKLIKKPMLLALVAATLISFCEGYYLQLLGYTLDKSDNEQSAKDFLSNYDTELQKLLTESTLAEWNYYTNLTTENEEVNNAVSLKVKYYLCSNKGLHHSKTS